MTIKKGYDNPSAWDKIEKSNIETHIIDDDLKTETVDDTDFKDSEVDDTDTDDKTIFDDDEEIKITDTEDFDEVIELTQYEDNLLPDKKDNLPDIVAQYTDVEPVELSKKHRATAKSFVSKITKFVLEFNDIELSAEHQKYIKDVGKLELQNLEDLLYLTDVNKQMLNNIIHRVNATQAEDYVIINSYNNLINQHIKLIRELSNTYRSIPNVLKKMRSDVLCNQELDSHEEGDEPITDGYGVNQFNSSKQFLSALLEKRKNKKLKSAEEEKVEENVVKNVDENTKPEDIIPEDKIE